MRDVNEPPSRELESLKILVKAYRSITFDEFAAVMAECGHGESYSKQVWVSFQHHPLGYIISRDPICQGNALLELLYKRCCELDRERERNEAHDDAIREDQARAKSTTVADPA